MTSVEKNLAVPKKTQMLPIKISLIYLFGTFAFFLASNMVNKVENLILLISFVVAAYSFLYLGYAFGIATKKNKIFGISNLDARRRKSVNIIVFVGAVYFILWGVNQINDFGGSDLSQVLRTISNPGTAYSAKFDVYENRIATGAVNRITQILIIFSIVYSIFVPVLVIYWRAIKPGLRIFASFSVFIYIVSFLFIGTQKGIGDIFLFILAGFSIAAGSRHLVIDAKLKRKITLIAAVISVVIFLYMALSQSSRAQEFGISTTMVTEDISSTWLAKFVGENYALGFYTILGYPSHGYLGLSYNLGTDYVFSYGAGFSQAFESYRHQFLGGDNNFLLTYPARTEVLTGWPAGMFWATAFPWFASDITFIGVLPLMLVVGFIFSRMWLSCIMRIDLISVAIFGQLIIFIAFLPANNQVLMQRQGLWIVVTAMFLKFIQLLSPRKL